MTECYGCGKELPVHGRNGYFWLAGKQRSFCPGRSYVAKRPCLIKAFKRLGEEHTCPVCGEGWSHMGQPCDDCEKMLKLGRETYSKTVSLRTEITAEILASFLRFDSWGDGNMAYPFHAVAEGEDRHSKSVELRRTIVNLWEKWAELHHAKGLVEGSNLLARLHAGETSLVDYEGEREKAIESIPVVKRDLEKLTLEVVERAKIGRLYENSVRDPEAPCEEFMRGIPKGTPHDCDGDGHYLCAECVAWNGGRDG